MGIFVIISIENKNLRNLGRTFQHAKVSLIYREPWALGASPTER